ncbi:MAG: biopolymer transporter ExbD [Blastocatellia bacterium]|nr:biopolymer transporter ExbD [Blastocatellia bacterium]
MNSKHDLFKSVKPTVNITPLIDVLLVLLIIFMVISPFKPHKLDTKIPEKPEATATPEDKTDLSLVVTLGFDRKLTLNSQPLTAAELSTKLKETLAARPANLRTLFIKAPRALPYNAVTEVIDLAKAAGAVPIGLQIDMLE